MPLTNFAALCDAYCELAGQEAPALEPDVHGTLAFTSRMREVDVTLLEFGPVRPGVVYLIAGFGAMSQDEALEGWRVLMDMNLTLLGAHCAAFGRQPATGEVVLQQCMMLADVTAPDVYQRASTMVDLALRWREDRFLGRRPTSLPVTLRPEPAAFAARCDASEQSALFFVLCEAICAAVGCAMPDLRLDENVSGLALQIEGRDVHVLHRKAAYADRAAVLVHLGVPSAERELPVLVDMMEANFKLMTQRDGAGCSRQRTSGAILLQYSLSLAGANAAQLLRQVAEFSQLFEGYSLA